MVTCRVVSPGEVGKQGEEEGGDGEREEKELDPNDDFKREMWLYVHTHTTPHTATYFSLSIQLPAGPLGRGNGSP